MLTFRNINIASAAILMVLIAANAGWWPYAILILVYSAIVFYGSATLSANFYLPTYCKAPGTNQQIAISFDDGPIEGNTSRILDILDRYNVKAAFFCIGERVSASPQVMQDLHRKEHLIGNHTFSHRSTFPISSVSSMRAELQDTSKAIRNSIGLRPKLFRPPYGVINPWIKSAIQKEGYTTIGWSVRSFDTMSPQPKDLLRRMKQRIAPGNVFLFHDTSEATISILPDFIECALSKGYSIVRLDKLFELKAYD